MADPAPQEAAAPATLTGKGGLPGGSHQVIVLQDGDADEVIAGLIHSASFSGPLPHPDLLKGYEEIEAGFAGRILAMAERDLSPRHEMERRALEAKVTEVGRGQLFGLAIGLTAILGGVGGGVVSAYLGHSWSGAVMGSVIGGGGLASLVAVFVIGRRTPDAPPPEPPAVSDEQPE